MVVLHKCPCRLSRLRRQCKKKRDDIQKIFTAFGCAPPLRECREFEHDKIFRGKDPESFHKHRVGKQCFDRDADHRIMRQVDIDLDLSPDGFVFMKTIVFGERIPAFDTRQLVIPDEDVDVFGFEAVGEKIHRPAPNKNKVHAFTKLYQLAPAFFGNKIMIVGHKFFPQERPQNHVRTSRTCSRYRQTSMVGWSPNRTCLTPAAGAE